MTQKYEEISKDMKRTLSTFINEKQEAVLLMSIFLSNNKAIQKALLADNADERSLYISWTLKR